MMPPTPAQMLYLDSLEQCMEYIQSTTRGVSERFWINLCQHQPQWLKEVLGHFHALPASPKKKTSLWALEEVFCDPVVSKQLPQIIASDWFKKEGGHLVWTLIEALCEPQVNPSFNQNELRRFCLNKAPPKEWRCMFEDLGQAYHLAPQERGYKIQALDVWLADLKTLPTSHLEALHATRLSEEFMSLYAYEECNASLMQSWHHARAIMEKELLSRAMVLPTPSLVKKKI